MSETPTPRTEAAVINYCRKRKLWPEFSDKVEKADMEQLERELNQAQQTIAQKDGELQKLRESLNGTLEFINELGHYDKPAYKQGEKAPSTTSPSAVVPWEVVEKYIKAKHAVDNALYQEAITPLETNLRMALLELQSYAPKGK